MAKTIEDSIVFAAKRQVWQRMIQRIIRPTLIAMKLWQNSYAVLLRRKAARRKAFWLFAIILSLYAARGEEKPWNLSSGSLSFLQVCYSTFVSTRQERVLILL